MKYKQRKGFTLVELIVVISIIVVIAGMTIPTVSGFMRQQRLKSAVSLIQMACMRAKHRAISQRERQYMVFFVKNQSYTLQDVVSGSTNKTKKGDLNTIYCYDSNESTTKRIDQVEQALQLPEFISYDTSKNTKDFQLTFYSDGTVLFIPSDVNKSNDPSTSNDTDIVFKQTGFHLNCYIDIVPNTSGIRFSIR